MHTRNPGNTLLSGITHTLDAAGRRISATYENNLGQAYAYDAASQLTHGRVGISNANQANAKQSSTHAYSYDSAGNRQSSLAFGQTSSYTTNSVNAYTSISGGGFQAPSPSYDANGNTLSLPRPDGSSQALTWDTHNRLRSVNVSSAQMTYDPRGRLVWIRNTNGTNPATDEIWSWSSWTLLAREVVQGGTPLDTFRYTWGPDLSGTLEGAGGVGGLLAIEHAGGNSTTWDIRHVHYDANGNVLALTNDAGQVSARYRYSPFGELLVSQNTDNSGWNERNLHRFSTKPEVAGTGLLYYGYRFYDPVTGRWPSRDPIEENGGINLYGFVGNNTTNDVDTLGLAVGVSQYSKLEKSWEEWTVGFLFVSYDRHKCECLYAVTIEKHKKEEYQKYYIHYTTDAAADALLDAIKLFDPTPFSGIIEAITKSNQSADNPVPSGAQIYDISRSTGDSEIKTYYLSGPEYNNVTHKVTADKESDCPDIPSNIEKRNERNH